MRRKKTLWDRLWTDRTLILMTIPAVAMLILFSYVPMSGIILAFKKYDFRLGIFGSPWNGVDNFKSLFMVGDTFWRLTRNTVGYFLLHTALLTVLEVAFALAINELKFRRAGKYIQSMAILPTFISFVAVAYIVNAFIDYNVGIVNTAIANGGGERINFYLRPEYWPLILTVVQVWRSTGYGSVLYLSALAGIDPELYESAEIDGANTWQKIFHISIPMLIPMISIRTLLSLGGIMKSGTGLYYQVTRNTGALYSTTQTIDAYLYNTMLGGVTGGTNWGSAAAVAFYQSVVGFVMVVGTNLIVRKKAPESALF